jgi:hypothetical protein
MKLKIRLLVLILFILFFNNSVCVEAAESPINVIDNYINNLNNNQWEEAASWWDKKSRQELLAFIAKRENQKYKCGILNIKEANLVRWKELPYDYGKHFLSSRYMEKFNNPRVFYVGVNYKVHTQNKYFIDGVNYFFIAMVREDEMWKIALAPHVPVQTIIYDGYGFGTDDEKTFNKRRLKFLNKKGNC